MVSEVESELFVLLLYGNDFFFNCSVNSFCRIFDRVLYFVFVFNLIKIFVVWGNYLLNVSYYFEKMLVFSFYGNGLFWEDV